MSWCHRLVVVLIIGVLSVAVGRVHLLCLAFLTAGIGPADEEWTNTCGLARTVAFPPWQCRPGIGGGWHYRCRCRLRHHDQADWREEGWTLDGETQQAAEDRTAGWETRQPSDGPHRTAVRAGEAVRWRPLTRRTASQCRLVGQPIDLHLQFVCLAPQVVHRGFDLVDLSSPIRHLLEHRRASSLHVLVHRHAGMHLVVNW